MIALDLKPLTVKQREVFEYCRGFLKKYHTIPSSSAICVKFNFSNRSVSLSYLTALVNKGYLAKWKIAGLGNSNVSGFKITENAMHIGFVTKEAKGLSYKSTQHPKTAN